MKTHSYNGFIYALFVAQPQPRTAQHCIGRTAACVMCIRLNLRVVCARVLRTRLAFFFSFFSTQIRPWVLGLRTHTDTHTLARTVCHENCILSLVLWAVRYFLSLLVTSFAWNNILFVANGFEKNQNEFDFILFQINISCFVQIKIVDLSPQRMTNSGLWIGSQSSQMPLMRSECKDESTLNAESHMAQNGICDFWFRQKREQRTWIHIICQKSLPFECIERNGNSVGNWGKTVVKWALDGGMILMEIVFIGTVLCSFTEEFAEVPRSLVECTKKLLYSLLHKTIFCERYRASKYCCWEREERNTCLQIWLRNSNEKWMETKADWNNFYIIVN